MKDPTWTNHHARRMNRIGIIVGCLDMGSATRPTHKEAIACIPYPNKDGFLMLDASGQTWDEAIDALCVKLGLPRDCQRAESSVEPLTHVIPTPVPLQALYEEGMEEPLFMLRTLDADEVLPAYLASLGGITKALNTRPLRVQKITKRF